MTSDLLSTIGAAELLGITPSEVLALEAQGVLKSYYAIPHQRRFSRSALLEYQAAVANIKVTTGTAAALTVQSAAESDIQTQPLASDRCPKT